MSYTFIVDPAHGWLKVSIDEIRKLGIAKNISNYSYVDSCNAFLEEDQDALIFIRAASGIDVMLPDNRKALMNWCAKNTDEIYFDQVEKYERGTSHPVRSCARFHSDPEFWLN